MQLGLVSKNACAGIRRHGNFAAIPRPEQKQQQKYDFLAICSSSKFFLQAAAIRSRNPISPRP
jgi:hypothetical protein